MVFPSDHHPSKVVKPGKKALNLPSATVSSKWSTILCFRSFAATPVRCNHLDSKGIQSRVQRITVVGLVTNHPLRKLNQETPLNRFSDQLHLMRRSAVHVEGVRKTRAVCNCHDFGAFAALSLPNSRAPFFAGENDPSIKASRMSSPPRSRRSSASARRISSNTPSFDHFWCQRWHVWYGGYRPGRSFHGAPVRRTHRMPLSTSRGLRRERPRGSDRLDCDGIKGSNRFHCSSVKSIWIHKTRFPQMSRLF